MRILVISRDARESERSGPAIRSAEISELARIHEVRVICPTPWTESIRTNLRGRASGESRALSGALLERPTYFADRDGAAYDRCVRNAFRRLAPADRPDAIVSSWAYPDGWTAVRIGQQFNIPVVLRALRLDVSVADQRVTERRARELRRADAIVAVSSALARRLTALGIEPERIHVVFPGVTRKLTKRSRASARASLGVPENGKVILFSGDAESGKGAADLIKACSILRDRGVDFSTYFVGAELPTRELRKMVRLRGLEERILFSPAPASSLSTWLQACDVFASPDYAPMVPTALRESLESGTPFIATRVYGVSEIAHPSFSRLVVAGEVGRLADALQDMLKSPLVVERAFVERINPTLRASVALFAGCIDAVVQRRAHRTATSHRLKLTRRPTATGDASPQGVVKWIKPKR